MTYSEACSNYNNDFTLSSKTSIRHSERPNLSHLEMLKIILLEMKIHIITILI